MAKNKKTGKKEQPAKTAKKGFFGNLFDKLDRKMKQKADKKKCSCKCGEKDDDGCCN